MAINPLQQPIQYGPQAQDPAQALLQGLQIGGAIRGMRTQRREEKETLALREKYKADLQAAMQSRNPQAWLDLAAMYPDQGKNLREQAAALGEEQRKNNMLVGAQTLNALYRGDVGAAKMIVDQQLEAAQNAGGDVSGLQAIRNTLDADPEIMVNQLSGVLSVISPDDFDKLVVAPFAAQTAAAEAGKATAEAGRAEILERFQADLSESQIERARAAAAASRSAERLSGAEADRAAAKAAEISAGIIPDEKKPDKEFQLRTQYLNQTANQRLVASAYNRVSASEDTAVGDLSLIFGYMKMLDPGSVVREGEFATAQNAAGVPDRIVNVYNRVVNGERLTADQRKSFVGQAQKLNAAAQGEVNRVKSEISNVARSYGLRPERIFGDEMQQPGAPAGAAPAATPAAGQAIDLGDGFSLQVD